MISSIVSRLVILVFGTLYPAYASYKAVRTKNVREYVKWMMYWIVFALFSCAETFTDVFLSFWFPFYYEIKILLVLWLLSPATKGSSILYRKFVHPMLSRREQDIDEYIAKAKEQGYHTVLHLGTKGVNYATTVIMQTAIKGGGGLVQQLRRSYSLGDLSSDVDGDSSSGRKALPEAQDRNRDRERVASGGDGRHHRPRGHSPRRSASGSGRVEMYFPEVDVDVRGASVREPSVPLSHIRSSEDVSSGYSSAEPLYQHGGSIGGGQHGESRPDSLASSREPLVRTASVGGSSRSTRTRSSRGGGGTVAKKGSSSGVPEASEECSLEGEDNLDMSSPSPSNSRSRSNSLPMSADLLRPELVALLQALNAELEQKVSMSKLSEIKMSESTEQMENTEESFHLAEGEITDSVHRTESSSALEVRGTKETSGIKVSDSSHPHPPDIHSAVDSDDDFYDSVSVPPIIPPNECQFKDTEKGLINSYSKTVNEPEKVNISLDQGVSGVRPVATHSSLPSSDILPNISEQHKTEAANDDVDIIAEAVGISTVEDCKDPQNLITCPHENDRTEIAILPKDINVGYFPESSAHSMSETLGGDNEGDKAVTSEEALSTTPTEIFTQLKETNHNIQREEKSLNCVETNQSTGDADKTDYNERKASETVHIMSQAKVDGNVSEQILPGTNVEISCANESGVTEEVQKITSNEFQDTSDSKDMTAENSISHDTSDFMQQSLSAMPSADPDKILDTIISTVESPCLQVDTDEKAREAEGVSCKSDGIWDSQTLLNYDAHTPESSDSHQDPKKDIRSGRYHKLQAPEPPPRSKRSSSKGSVSEDGELKSEHRSRSPKKMVESSVARLHGQIENLASMLPFWQTGKRSRGKEDGSAGNGFRIREMSRSPSRRVGDQAPL